MKAASARWFFLRSFFISLGVLAYFGILFLLFYHAVIVPQEYNRAYSFNAFAEFAVWLALGIASSMTIARALKLSV